MDNERPNDRTLWSRRLEEPGALPGTGLTDREAAWDRLYDRLKEAEGPRRRQRMIWLWAAAACILLIVIPAVLLLKDGGRNTRRDNVKPSMVTVTPASASPGSDASNTKTAQNPPVQPNPYSGRSRQTRQPVSVDPFPVAPVIAGAPAPVRGPHPSLAPTRRPDLGKLLARDMDTLSLVAAPGVNLSKPITVIAAAPRKKELRVVHINDLESSQPTPATAKGPREKPGGLYIRFAPEEIIRPSTSYADPAGQAIIPLKHAQNP